MKIKKIKGKKFINNITSKNINEDTQGQDFFKFMEHLHLFLEKERVEIYTNKIAEKNDEYE